LKPAAPSTVAVSPSRMDAGAEPNQPWTDEGFSKMFSVMSDCTRSHASQRHETALEVAVGKPGTGRRNVKPGTRPPLPGDRIPALVGEDLGAACREVRGAAKSSGRPHPASTSQPVIAPPIAKQCRALRCGRQPGVTRTGKPRQPSTNDTRGCRRADLRPILLRQSATRRLRARAQHFSMTVVRGRARRPSAPYECRRRLLGNTISAPRSRWAPARIT